MNNSNVIKLPKIIAVSKTFKIDKILPLIDYGHLDFGENKVQEAMDKWTEIKSKYPNTRLHMIGKLQTNKVKFAVKLFDYIHSIDSEKLAKKISEEQNVSVKCNTSLAETLINNKNKEITELEKIYKSKIEIIMGLVGKKAPKFSATAVINGGDFQEEFSLEQYVGKKKVVFFFYPMDFTFVCPTELLAFQEKLAEFEKRDVVVVGCSVDSHFSHWAWLNTPKDNGGIQGVEYPIVADFDKTISMNYGVLAGEYTWDEDGNWGFEGAPVAYRGLFLIDEEGVVRHELINDLPLGRNVGEALRVIDALAHNQKYGEVCPANWSEGDDAMTASSEGVADYLSKH